MRERVSEYLSVMCFDNHHHQFDCIRYNMSDWIE